MRFMLIRGGKVHCGSRMAQEINGRGPYGAAVRERRGSCSWMRSVWMNKQSTSCRSIFLFFLDFELQEKKDIIMNNILDTWKETN